MPLAKRNNGCLECRQRRLCCDKAEPECLKCRKKGIKCSGQGIECRFSAHMIAEPPAGSSKSATGVAGTNISANDSTVPSRAAKGYRWRNTVSTWPERRSSRPKEAGSPARHGPAILSVSPVSGKGSPLRKTSGDDGRAALDALSPSIILDRRTLEQSIMRLSSPRPAMEVVPAQARMLFDHFSNFIAAKMVLFDFTGNGYRQIILPLACQDEMVGQAVSVIAAFHLSQQAPHMRMAAEMGQQAILSRLCHDALSLEPKRFFNLSTWATVLVLLVGDTITGSNNYVHLLELLSSLAQSSASVQSLSDNTRAFITQQTRMFELFGFPLSSEKKGLKALKECPDYYLDFMTPSPSLSLDAEQYSNSRIMKDAIRQACELYRNRALRTTSRELSIEAVERLRQTVLDLDASVDGCHALVWPYFVAAAESILPEHRDFFSNRLSSLFGCTGFGTIPLALETLEIIWASQSSSSWTEIVTHQRPILIM